MSRVFCMEPDGMKNAWNRKVRISTARQKATTNSNGNSCHRGMFFLPSVARCRQDSSRASWLTCLPCCTSAPRIRDYRPRLVLRAVAQIMSARTGCRTERNATHPPRKGRSLTPVWRSRESSVCRLIPLLLDLCRLTPQIAQVVELGPAHVATGDDLDAVQQRAVDRVRALDPDATGDLPHRERLAQAGALATDHHTLEDLDPGPVALDDPGVHLERVASAEVRDV